MSEKVETEPEGSPPGAFLAAAPGKGAVDFVSVGIAMVLDASTLGGPFRPRPKKASRKPKRAVWLA